MIMDKSLVNCSNEDALLAKISQLRSEKEDKVAIEDFVSADILKKEIAVLEEKVSTQRKLSKEQCGNAVNVSQNGQAKSMQSLEMQLQELLRKEDYEGAALLQKKIKDLKSDLQGLLDKKDYKKAAAVQCQLKGVQGGCASADKENLPPTSGASLEDQILKLDTEISECVRQEDYSGASVLKEKRASLQVQAVAVPSDPVIAAPVSMKDKLEEMIVNQDFTGCAELKREIDKLQSELDAALQKCDFEGAAECKAKLTGVPRTMPLQNAAAAGGKTTTKGTAKGTDSRREAVDVQVSDLLLSDEVLPSSVNLRRVQVLSIGRLDAVPVPPGSKGKAVGKGKSKSKGKGKGERQNCRIMYLGKDGYVCSAIAYGADVVRIPNDKPDCEIDICNLVTRAGQPGMLSFCAETGIVHHMKTHHLQELVFPYDTLNVTDDFASLDHVQGKDEGAYVALVVQVTKSEERQTWETGQPYTIVEGYDMFRMPTGKIMMWHFLETDFELKNAYIFRGVQVAPETAWNAQQQSYLPRADGRKTVKCNSRTAVEDVSHVHKIMEYFS